MATSKRGYRPPAKNKSTKKGGVEKGYVQITAAAADILKEAGFFDDYQLGSNSPVPADSETFETVATEAPPTDE